MGAGWSSLSGIYGNSNAEFSSSTTTLTNGLCHNSSPFGYTSQDVYPRLVGDYNGDGKDDFIAIRNDGVYITYSQGRGNTFSAETKIEDKFGPNQNWANQETSPRWVGDVDGDGKDDIIGFHDNPRILYAS